MHINEDHLRSLTFIGFLKWVKENLTYLRHRSKTDIAIDDAHSLARIISYRMVSEYRLTWDEYQSNPNTTDFWQNKQILDSYKGSLSDKKKGEIINEYRKNLETDISILLARTQFNATNNSVPNK